MAFNAEVLVIGGGGGGADAGTSTSSEAGSGGGGGGGADANYSSTNSLTVGTYAIIVGAGGSGSYSSGGSSSFNSSLLAYGGTYGYEPADGGAYDGGAGGNGGDAGSNGGAGGNGTNTQSAAGGGGGGGGHHDDVQSGGAGGDGGGSRAGAGGTGAQGYSYSIGGLSGTYCGAGGGGGGGGVLGKSDGYAGTAGSGGGGAGGAGGGNNGANATLYGAGAGGGGGSSTGSEGSGGTGSSGIVIIAYLTSAATGYTITGGTETTSGLYTINTFTSNGSLVLSSESSSVSSSISSSSSVSPSSSESVSQSPSSSASPSLSPSASVSPSSSVSSSVSQSESPSISPSSSASPSLSPSSSISPSSSTSSSTSSSISSSASSSISPSGSISPSSSTSSSESISESSSESPSNSPSSSASTSESPSVSPSSSISSSPSSSQSSSKSASPSGSLSPSSSESSSLSPSSSASLSLSPSSSPSLSLSPSSSLSPSGSASPSSSASSSASASSSPEFIPLVYIESSPGTWQEFQAYEYFHIKKKLNNTSEFEIKFYDIKDDEKVYLKRNVNIMFYMGSTRILNGITRVVKYESGYECVVSGYCNSVKLMDKPFMKGGYHRVEYDNTSAQTAANEILSTGSDGSSPWDMTPDVGGLFATDHGNVFLRFEYSNKLQCMAKLAESIGYEWEVKQEDADLSEDIFVLKEYLPSTTEATVSQGTFVVGGATENCEKTSLETDTQNMANKITVLGYGDGENQLSTTVYSASLVNSTIDIDLTETTGTIDLVDATDFAASGTSIIGAEQISWTSKSGNSLVGCVRGDNSTTAAKHLKGCYIEKYTSIDSPEADSSVEEYGIISNTYVDRSILNLETLELIASKKLLEKKDPIVTIKIIPEDVISAAEEYKIGDLITIDDSESSLDDDYRIIEIDYSSEYGMISIELTASTSAVTFTSQSQKNNDAEESLQKYMQGATNIYAINEAENCDATHPLNMRCWIPNEAIAINRILLNFKLKDYRAYSSGVTGAPDSQTNSSIWAASNAANYNFGWTSVSSFTDGVVVSDNVDSAGGAIGYYMGTDSGFTGSLLLGASSGPSSPKYVPFSTSAWSNVDDVLSVDDSGTGSDTNRVQKSGWVSETANPDFDIPVLSPELTGTFDKIRVSFSYYHGTLTGRTISFYLQRSETGASWSTVDSWTSISVASGETISRTTEETTDYSGYLYRIKIDNSYVNDQINLSTCVINVSTFMKMDVDLTYGIEEEALSSPSVVLKVGEDGETLTTIDTYTDDNTEVDITSVIREVGAGKWINMEFTPNKNMRIEANAYVQIFIESK